MILDVLHVLIISESVLMVMFCNVSIQLDQLTNIVPCKDLYMGHLKASVVIFTHWST